MRKSVAQKIADEVCEQFGVSMARIRGRSKAARFVAARFTLVRRLRKELGWSWPEIAKFAGYANHTSAMYAGGAMEKGSK